MLKKMLWKVGVYSCLPERLIGDGRDSAKRVVLTSIPLNYRFLPKSLLWYRSENCFEVVPDLLDGRNVAALIG